MTRYVCQAARLRATRRRNSGSKFKNQKTEVSGVSFDSRAEMRFFLVLQAQREVGQIREVECQPRIKLFPDPIVKGRHVTYIADFRVVRNDGTDFFVDVKGSFTAKDAVYRLKIKCLLFFHPGIELHERIYDSKGVATVNVYKQGGVYDHTAPAVEESV